MTREMRGGEILSDSIEINQAYLQISTLMAENELINNQY